MVSVTPRRSEPSGPSCREATIQSAEVCMEMQTIQDAAAVIARRPPSCRLDVEPHSRPIPLRLSVFQLARRSAHLSR